MSEAAEHRSSRPNKHINLTRPTVSVVTSGRSPRSSCAVRWAEKVEAFPVLD